MRVVLKIVRILSARVYRRQIAIEFPLEVIAARSRELSPLPTGYELRQPPLPGDAPAIADLLQQEPGFGEWTGARVQDEILTKLAYPAGAVLVLHNGVPAAFGYVADASTRHMRIGHGMYLYVAPAHRSRTQVAVTVTYTTFGPAAAAGYQRIIAFTDPERLSALLLYLSTGARPLYDTISSFWQWRRILRRLAPALQRLARQRAARAAAQAAGGS
jgi:hypothetical protein